MFIYLLLPFKNYGLFYTYRKMYEAHKCSLLDSYKEKPDITTIQIGDCSVASTLEAPSHGSFSLPPVVAIVRKHYPDFG